ncbi:MAG: hypothetical protein EWM51_11620 [Treponema sp.]|nr:MAG: hypothetical protein EWM51_11620 [Treponema sp.]HPX47509.1 UPF0164 family protein [Treponemataceae bacterium]
MKIRRLSYIFILLLYPILQTAALDLSDPYMYVSGIIDPLIDPNEGETTFRSLLIPGGGRSEAMGSAFTALADDISFFDTNPSGSSTMKNTELAVLHNSWIADSRLETVSYTVRLDNLGMGASARCFYVPFTEYNTFGERVSRGYYTETVATLNASYNFLAGYYFKGIAVGANLKAGFRSMPDYSDNYGNLQQGSGAGQSAATFMVDIGAQTRFNLLKLYSSRDPNFHVGATLRNAGPPVSGEALPTVAAAGVAWKMANPITFSGEIQQPLNFMNLKNSGRTVFGAGFSVEFASFFTLLGGLQLKGANPRISLGGEMNVNDIQFNINYTLDMTTQAAVFNRISLAAKLNLGDRGRADRQKRIEKLYIEGLRLYALGELDEAVEVWNAALDLDKRFDPAIEGVRTALYTIQIQQEIRKLQILEDSEAQAGGTDP